MKHTLYHRIHDYVTQHPSLRQAVVLSTKLLPGIVYAAYPLMLLWLLVFQRQELLRAILVPAIGFLATTWLRAWINAPRPYEQLDIPPISKKDTVGKSFPSRHAACAAVIAVTALHALLPLGIALSIVALLIALSRVLAGVHFLKDVLCGLLLGGVIGWLGMYMIP